MDDLCQAHALYEHSTYEPSVNLKLWNYLMLREHPKISCYLVKDESKVVGYFSFTIDYSTWTAEKFLYLDGGVKYLHDALLEDCLEKVEKYVFPCGFCHDCI